MTVKCLVGTHSSQDMYKEWSSKRKDSAHREDCKAYGMFTEFHSVNNPPPWRLTKDQLHTIIHITVPTTWDGDLARQTVFHSSQWFALEC